MWEQEFTNDKEQDKKSGQHREPDEPRALMLPDDCQQSENPCS